MWTELWIGVSLVMVIEGLLPALSPKLYRKAMFSMMQLDSRSLRITGLVSMTLGALLLYFIKN